MIRTLNRLRCALFRHAPSRVVERVGEWTIRECPRCGEWWAEPSVKWMLYEDARRSVAKLTEVHRALIDRAARGVDKKMMEGLDNHGKCRYYYEMPRSNFQGISNRAGTLHVRLACYGFGDVEEAVIGRETVIIGTMEPFCASTEGRCATCPLTEITKEVEESDCSPS